MSILRFFLYTLPLLSIVPRASAQQAGGQHTKYRTVAVDSVNVFYREAGPQDAPSLLLLHGFPSSSRMFEPLFSRAGAPRSRSMDR